jgi:hypothetical protein
MAKQKRAAIPAETKVGEQPNAERCKWDPAYCAKVEALGAEGKSAPEIRRELGIPASTWRAWVKKHPEFAEAVEEAADAAEAWWIDLMLPVVLFPRQVEYCSNTLRARPTSSLFSTGAELFVVKRSCSQAIAIASTSTNRGTPTPASLSSCRSCAPRT